MTKHVMIVVLVGINLLLLAGVLLVTYSPPAAMAQAAAVEGSADGDYIVTTAEVELNNDIIYVFDVRNEFLHAFRTHFPRVGESQPVQLRHVFTRDLSRDFKEPEGGRGQSTSAEKYLVTTSQLDDTAELLLILNTKARQLNVYGFNVDASRIVPIQPSLDLDRLARDAQRRIRADRRGGREGAPEERVRGRRRP